MDVVNERCCGLDVHKQTVVACITVPGNGRQPHKEVRTFGTMTADLLELADWLGACEVTHVAMESTGVYWKPIWNLLEGQVELLLVNAHHVKQVPGRKTDVKDCEWLADLLRHGLLRASFVPDRPQRELRELTRYRTSLIRERAAAINRVQKTLEGANIKLGDVASHVLGVSGRQILTTLVAGTADPSILADFARGKLRSKLPQLERALLGQFESHQRFLLAQQLTHLDALDELIERLSGEFRKCRARYSGGGSKRNGFGLEQRLTQTSFEILASEAPGEWFLKGGVASAEGVKGIGQFLEAGVVIRLEHLALDNRKVNFDLIQPARIRRSVHDDDARMACTQLFCGTLAAMR